MLKSIHQSSLGMALRCGEQFRRRYIEGEIIPPSIGLARGKGVHKANKENLRQKIVTDQDMKKSDMIDAARDEYVNSLSDGVFLPKDKQSEKKRLVNEGLEDAVRCTVLYADEVAPEIQPISVEESFEIDVGLPLPLAGTMDYQKKAQVGDLKSTAMKWNEDRIKEEIQVPFYSFVHEKQKGIRPEFIYHILIARRGKTGPTSEEYQPLSTKVEIKDYNALFEKISIFIQMLKTGIFPPANPSNWYCGADWCGYWATCRYCGNAPAKKWI